MTEEADTLNSELERALESNKDYQLAMLGMIITKIKRDKNLGSFRGVCKYIGYSERHVREILRGRRTLTPRFIQSILFASGVSINELDKEYVKRDLDEYVNGDGNLIIDGVDYGKMW